METKEKGIIIVDEATFIPDELWKAIGSLHFKTGKIVLGSAKKVKSADFIIFKLLIERREK